MGLRRIGLVILVYFLPIVGCYAGEHFPGARWQHASPQATGWSAAKLAKAEAWSNQIGSTAVMVIEHGLVVAQWGDTAARTPLASVRKSLLSALIGIAVARHQIDLDATLDALHINDSAPSLSAEEKAATVRDLLEARSGVYHPACYESRWMAKLRPLRYSHKPDTFWYYNNWDFNTLGAIYVQATGASIFGAFEREIARPIGMQDYRPSDGRYFTCNASVYPAYPFHMSARDLARFALLYLNHGMWNGRQIVPAQWVEDSVQPYSQSGFGPGYGYLWWTGFADNNVAPIVKLPVGTFFAWGFGGQFAFVIPADDLVVVSRAPHAPGGPSLREMGRLLWLILDAGGYSDIGPDASLAAAHGTHEDGAELARLLPGKTLMWGDGPFLTRMNPDHTFVFYRGSQGVTEDSGSWSVVGDEVCRYSRRFDPHDACLDVVRDGAQLEFFGGNGLMVAEAHMVGQ